MSIHQPKYIIVNIEATLSIRKQLEGLSKLVRLRIVHLQGASDEDQQTVLTGSRLMIKVIKLVHYLLKSQRFNLLRNIF